jgi:hypothetical protein
LADCLALLTQTFPDLALVISFHVGPLVIVGEELVTAVQVVMNHFSERPASDLAQDDKSTNDSPDE